jgi:hypothetical protein
MRGPILQLIYDIDGRAAGALKQLSVSDVVVFNESSTAGPVFFAFHMEGVPVHRVPWPEYSDAVSRYKATGAPRFVDTEIWVVWGERGHVLRELLKRASNPLDVRLEDDKGQVLKSAVYELEKRPLDDRAAVADLVDDTADKECPFGA